MGIIYSCADNQGQKETDQLTSAEIEAQILSSNFIPFNMPFPEGTQFEVEGSSINFTLPKTHYIVGIDSDGEFHKSFVGGTGSVTCECTEGSGCDPITNKNGTGCLMKDGCSKCTKTTSSINGFDEEMKNIAIMSLETNLYINDFSQLNNRYYLPKDFLAFEGVQEILTNVQSEINADPNVETKTVFADVLGYVVALDVPANKDNVSLAVIGGGDDAGISCSCDVEGSCPLEKHWTGTKWCNSDNCTKCTMSGVSIKMNGEVKEFAIEKGLMQFK